MASLIKSTSKKIKSKGLQKLKYYCQACEKQCRDENGFKCHTMSESHFRQMQLFGQNPNHWIDLYSQQFQTGFMDIIRRRARSQRVAATVIYNEYISDRNHVHMNATKWTSLSEFVSYLGKTCMCKVEEDRDRENGCLFVLCNEEDDNLSFSDELADEAKIERNIVRQIGLAGGGGPAKEVIVDDFDSISKENKKVCNRNILTELLREEDEKKERKSYWLCEGIVVKIVSNKTKGIVRKVVDRFFAKIEVDDKNIVRVHQDEVETVI